MNREIWDNIAKTWSYYRVKPAKELIDWLKRKKGRFLDVGCGTGRHLKEIIKHGETYAIDISKEMINYAKKLYPNVYFKISSQENIPFKNNFFDYVISWATLHHSENPVKSIKEINRVLKKGGKALVSVWKKKGVYGWKCVYWNAKDEAFPRLTYFFRDEELEKIFKKVDIKFKRIYKLSKNLIYELEK